MLVVGVVVIDWTLTGASPPTRTLPTRIWRLLRRGASTAGIRGIPMFTAGTPSAYAALLRGGSMRPCDRFGACPRTAPGGSPSKRCVRATDRSLGAVFFVGRPPLQIGRASCRERVCQYV